MNPIEVIGLILLGLFQPNSVSLVAPDVNITIPEYNFFYLLLRIVAK